jgi:EAL domain-containing protein (putative c-di-GMP-specific phosphodiesterase class I)
MDSEHRQPPLCFVVDDEPAIGRFIGLAARRCGVRVEQFLDFPSMAGALTGSAPKLIFIDVSLGASDAIDAIRFLSAENFAGSVQLMSGCDAALLEDVRRIGELHGLRMHPPLAKPFRVDAVKRIIESDLDSPIDGAPYGHFWRNDEERQFPQLDLRKALDRGWIEMWYQPKVDLYGPALAGAEGLARLRHPEYGVVPPSAFIPSASGVDLVALADFALRTAVQDSVAFADLGYPTRLAINVPIDALVRLPIAAIVRDALPDGNEQDASIILELTEDQVVHDIASARKMAGRLRSCGIGLSLDDFGKGQASLALLGELPFAEIKLDRSLVTGCGVDPRNAALCRTVVELAHRLGCLAVAEGVETVDDLATVRRVGCDIAQGYLFAHPMPRDMLLARLIANGGGGGFTAMLASNVGDDFRAIA